MFRSLLVPLDGSTMAEQAVFPAAEIARRLGAALTLAVVHPSGPLEEAPFPGTAPDEQLRAAEGTHLEALRLRTLATFHVPAEICVLGGDIVPSLVACAGERNGTSW
jgi:nucleotide-binding universal stress UspA family protein